MSAGMNILLLGCGGQVGWELQRALAPLGQVLAHDADTANFTQPQQVAGAWCAIDRPAHRDG